MLMSMSNFLIKFGKPESNKKENHSLFCFVDSSIQKKFISWIKITKFIIIYNYKYKKNFIINKLNNNKFIKY